MLNIHYRFFVHVFVINHWLEWKDVSDDCILNYWLQHVFRGVSNTVIRLVNRDNTYGKQLIRWRNVYRGNVQNKLQGLWKEANNYIQEKIDLFEIQLTSPQSTEKRKKCNWIIIEVYLVQTRYNECNQCNTQLNK